MNILFKDKISVFESFHSEPKTISLGQWLNTCKNGSRYAKQVFEYRHSKDEQLKKSLPLATVGAVCSGGRKLENVTTRTGWIALDIDGKDNPHLTDAEQIRDDGRDAEREGGWPRCHSPHRVSNRLNVTHPGTDPPGG
jgi:hypothetical protein